MQNASQSWLAVEPGPESWERGALALPVADWTDGLHGNDTDGRNGMQGRVYAVH